MKTKTTRTSVETALSNSKGRFLAVRTHDGRVFNCKLVKETQYYVTFNEMNLCKQVKLAKNSINQINKTYVW